MKKYLKSILIKTFTISLTATMLLLTLLFIVQPTDNSNLHFNATAMIYGLSTLIVLALTVLSTTIFLDLMPRIRQNSFKSFLTFTLLPIITAITLTILSHPIFSLQL